MVLVVICSAAVFIAINSTKSQVVAAAAQKIASDIRYAQSLAQNKRDWHGIAFDAPSNSYTVYSYDLSASSETAVQNPAKLGSDFQIAVGDSYDGISISDVQCNASMFYDYILFNADGVPCDNFGNAYTGTSEVKVSHSSGAYKWIYVAPQSGNVTVQ